MEMKLRKFNPEKDKKAGYRIWKEVGWLEKGKEKVMDIFLKCCDTWVAEINGEAEFLALTTSGTFRYLEEELPFSGITGVTTSRIARKLGLAKEISAYVIAKAAEKGAWISGLGIFEQGFYNLLGYGSGGYEHIIYFDPADLKIDVNFRVPERLYEANYRAIHKSRLNRLKTHGAVSFDDYHSTQAEIKWTKQGFGLGYFDGPNGELTHHFWASNRGGEHGPYFISWLAYQNYDQFLELMALIKSLGDQVRLIGMTEPAEIQLQDFLKYPFRYRIASEKSKYESKMRAASWWQMRICNLEKCLEKTHLQGEEVSFNLELSDPIEEFLAKDTEWKGISGNYIIKLGEQSSALKGKDKSLPTLQTSVGPFTRMWLGVRPATGLAVTEDINAPKDLLKQLNKVFLLPDPKPGWEY